MTIATDNRELNNAQLFRETEVEENLQGLKLREKQT
jgi:hypothetical protein